MKHFKNKLKSAGSGFFLSLFCSVPALAEDIEIYTQAAGVATVKPNVLFVLDNSGSMTELVPRNSSDPFLKEQYVVTNTYSGGCFDATKVYYSTDGRQPLCGSANFFDLSDLHCSHAFDEYNDLGFRTSVGTGPIIKWGTYADQMAQHGTTDVWGKLKENNLAVECAQDQGVHGSNSAPTPNAVITNTSTGWTSGLPGDPLVWQGGKNAYTLYHGNYLNYLTDPGVPLRATRPTRFDEVKRAIEALIDTNTSINIGLQTFDAGFDSPYKFGTDRVDGGGVIFPVTDINTSRVGFKAAMNALIPITGTPLSETYHEALQYFGGRQVRYGTTSVPATISAVVDGSGNYISPITNECQKNSIVVLTDGLPSHDNINTTELGLLPGFVDTANCARTDTEGVYGASACMEYMAGWANTGDVIADDGTPERDGVQTISTHTVGFAEPALSAPGSLIVKTAAAGDGQFIAADNADSLRSAISKIFADVLDVSTTFSSPAVSVNAFNRSVNLEDLYFSLFTPSSGPQWTGNLKKYKLDFKTVGTDRVPFIADASNNEAVDPAEGFFKEDALSYWSDVVDGNVVEAGGAAGELANNLPRKVYTYTDGYTNNSGVFVPDEPDLTGSGNVVEESNSDLTDTLLNITSLPDAIPGTPRRETLVDWMLGVDVLDNNDNGDFTELRGMGDPLHSQPALVQYGGTIANPDLVAYVATNDGYLHAFDADNGEELFAFIPQELLTSQNALMEDSAVTRPYGLDGDVVAWINDINNDGIINGSDNVYLYITMRRGGKNIYSIDVTDRDSPTLRWVIKGGTPGSDYEELAQTWSTVNVETLKDGTAEKTVLIFGGGYDESQDNTTVRTPDGEGKAIFIADAVTGERLWSAGTGGDLAVSNMDYSIPARVKPLDLSGDGFIDRLYVADVGGQIFRFDIDNTNGSSLAGSITGGRIASLAGAGVTNARRFYYPPDVALIAQEGKTPYLAVAIASGFRAHPNNEDVHDRIYVIKDNDVYNTPSPYVTVTELQLFDVTENLIAGDGTAAENDSTQLSLDDINNRGWRISLDDGTNTNTYVGEKGLSEVLILEGAVIATTFTPINTANASNSCEPQSGDGKVYFIDLLDGTAAFPSDADVRTDRVKGLSKEGIPPSPSVIITEGGEPTLCIGTECESANLSSGVRKTFWYEVEK